MRKFFLAAAQRLRDTGNCFPRNQFEVAKPPQLSCPEAKLQQVGFRVTGTKAEHAELSQRFWITAFDKSVPLGLSPQSLSQLKVLLDGLAQFSQQSMGDWKVATTVLPQSGRADADFASELR